MNQAKIESRAPTRASPVWIVPGIALIFGGWLVVDSYLSQGPVVDVTFANAEGIKAGETQVKRLSVELGTVEEVYLNEGYSDVTVVIQFDEGTQELLRQDSQFWVVKPRVGADGISGLSTILSGAYIELSPGIGAVGKRDFEGLDTAPVTPRSTPGNRISLVSEGNNSLSSGEPVLYNGYKVGLVENSDLSVTDGKTYYDLFVEAPYDQLITTNTKFWNASGITFDAGVNGVSVSTGSLEAILSGGVAFGLTEGTPLGDSISEGAIYELYPSFTAIPEQNFEYSIEYMLLFDSSVRGLSIGAPVEYRGIRFGTVTDISFELVDPEDGFNAEGRGLMPVLISIDPGRFLTDTNAALEEVSEVMTQAVSNGMRASLSNGNLITGSLYVSLDFQNGSEPAQITELAGRKLLPTSNAGLAQLEQQVSQVLTKIQELPIENSLALAASALESMTTTVGTADQTLQYVNDVLEETNTAQLPQKVEAALNQLSTALGGISPGSPIYLELNNALDELTETLRNTRELSATIEAEPRSLIFPTSTELDLIPRRNSNQ